MIFARIGESFADVGEVAIAKQEYFCVSGDGEVEIVSFDDANGGIERPDPFGVSFFGEFGETDVYLVKRRFKTLDRVSPRIAVVFFFGEGSEEVDNVGGVFTPIIDGHGASEHAERLTGDIVGKMLKAHRVRLQKTVSSNGYFDGRRRYFFRRFRRSNLSYHRWRLLYHKRIAMCVSAFLVAC